MGVARSPFRLPLEIAMNKPTKAQAHARTTQARPAQGRPAQQRNVQQQTASEAEYFNLHASGCGYLSRVRWVDPNQRRGGRTGEAFLACAINARLQSVACAGVVVVVSLTMCCASCSTGRPERGASRRNRSSPPLR